MTVVPLAPPTRLVELEVDGRAVRVPEGSTILDALRGEGVGHADPLLRRQPHGERVPGVRRRARGLAGARASCARKAEAGMKVKTDSERVRLSRKMVLEFLGSSTSSGSRVPTSNGGRPTTAPIPRATARRRAGRGRARRTRRPPSRAGRHGAETVHQPVKVDNELYVRDYSRCILCYKCVEACGVDAQNTFAISWRVVGSTRGSRPSSTSGCRIPRACTAGTASACARPAR